MTRSKPPEDPAAQVRVSACRGPQRTACEGKRPYQSEAVTKRAAWAWALVNGEGLEWVEVYDCTWCWGWHWGHG